MRFMDGEILEGESEAVNLEKMGFPMSIPQGNSQIAWVSLASIKYVLFPDSIHAHGEVDPREQVDIKVVLHFGDGEVMRTYKDDAFQQEGEGFNLRIWDPHLGGLLRVIVSLHALKAIFFVREWDGRTEEERLYYSGPSRPAGEAGGAL
ncbi:MAG: hypothetical protein M3O87_01850 [Candidatus Dormibacteraeota bacterium]|nr:hypothetical protein [Candidatus Dormibacteraeota bacterium]